MQLPHCCAQNLGRRYIDSSLLEKILIIISLSWNVGKEKKVPTSSEEPAVIPIKVEREFLAQFSRRLDNHVVERVG